MRWRVQNKSSGIARPYAKAVFELAEETQALELWSSVLSCLSHVVETKAVCQWLKNPEIDFIRATTMIVDTTQALLDKMDAVLNEQQKNFIQVLLHAHRFDLLPVIYTLYENFCAQKDNRVPIEVTSAISLTQDQRTRLTDTLSKKWGACAEIIFKEEPELIGGMVVRLGSWVWNASVAQQLHQLKKIVKR